MSGDRRRSFNGTDSFLETHKHLESVAGNATWLSSNQWNMNIKFHWSFTQRIV